VSGSKLKLYLQSNNIKYLQRVNGSGGSVPGTVVTSVPSLNTSAYSSFELKRLLNVACFITAASRISFAEDEAGTLSGSESPRLIFLTSSITAIVILTLLSFGFARFDPFFRTKKELVSFSFADLKALKLLSDIFVVNFNFFVAVEAILVVALIDVAIVSLLIEQGAAAKEPSLSILITTGCPHCEQNLKFLSIVEPQQ
jgi:hypothetical protein